MFNRDIQYIDIILFYLSREVNEVAQRALPQPHLSLYKILLLPIWYDVWHTHGGSEGGSCTA